MKPAGVACRQREADANPNLDAQDGDTGKIIPVSSVSLHEGEKGTKSEEFRRGKSSQYPRIDIQTARSGLYVIRNAER